MEEKVTSDRTDILLKMKGVRKLMTSDRIDVLKLEMNRADVTLDLTDVMKLKMRGTARARRATKTTITGATPQL